MGLKTVLIITWQDVYVASQHAKGGEDMITVVNIYKKKSYSQADNRGWEGLVPHCNLFITNTTKSVL